MKPFFSFLFLVIFSVSISAQKSGKPEFLTIETPWADSVFATLSQEEKIAQMFMVAAYSNKDAAHVHQIEKLVRDQKIGGLIFFQGGPVRQANLTNRYQQLAKTPLFIAMDAEWGLGMRLDSTISFPRQMTLGAIQDESLIYAMGEEIARECNRLGVQINFAPVVDVNNNPKNPVINNRSFGEDKMDVAKKGAAYMEGMQAHRVLANAKHFPGHGDTDTDSHLSLPIVNHSRKRLDSLELYPFRSLIQNGLGSAMVAHLYIPSLDSTPNLASTLSKPVVTDLLKKEMGFEGLIFTDALNMKGVSKYFPPGEVDVKAAIAGNDVLLFAEDVPTAIAGIQKAIRAGEISQADIDQRCHRILKAKEWTNLHKWKAIDTRGLVDHLNNKEAIELKKRLIENALTVLNNDKKLIPVKRADTLKIAALSIGAESGNHFQAMLKDFADVDFFDVSATPPVDQALTVINKLQNYDLVIIGVHKLNNNPSRNFGFSDSAMELIRKIDQKKNVILNFFGNPYALEKFSGVEKIEGLIIGYNDDVPTREASAQLIFGAIPAKGKLPVSIGNKFRVFSGMELSETIRLKFSTPEEVGIMSSSLAKIDSIVIKGMKAKAFPGCQVVVAVKGKIIYRKSFGYHTYENVREVNNNDIYDLASITKMVSSTAGLMRLQDKGKFNLDKRLGDYLPERLPDSLEYSKIVLRDMMAHRAGLIPWIPFHSKTLINKVPNPKIYQTLSSYEFPLRVAEGLYINQKYSDSLLARITSTPLAKKEYKYSDLGYYFVREIIQKLSGNSLDEFVAKEFYRPLGMRTTGYLPLNKFDLKRIVPTEYDPVFRKQLVHGDVHDPGAAMQGGVGGHAGLFSNATDLAIFMQMLINGGHYAGQQFLNEKTIKEYTNCQFCKNELDKDRRGAGFDKPVMEKNKPGPTCSCVPFESFGHTGFTGTIAWADPENEVVYIFLSNRVYPTAANNKLAEMNIRTDIQQVIYDALAGAVERKSDLANQ